MRAFRTLCALCIVACLAGPARAQSDVDDLLRTAESRFAAALAWLKRQREAAGAEVAQQVAEAQKKLDEIQISMKDDVSPAVVRLAVRGAGESIAWRICRPKSDNELPERLVVLVHGLDEPGGIWDEAAPAIVSAGHDLARFDYANDQGVARSADELAAALRSLYAGGVRRVDLVCHSMGGLVARDVLTREAHYAGDARGRGRALPRVERLILIGTPNRGSAFADLQRVSEMREQFVRWIDSGGADSHAATAFLRDGRGEAAADLEIGSAFLTELNARPLPTGVRIGVIAGRLGDEGVANAMELLDSPIVRGLMSDERIAWFKATAGSLQREIGDGVVSVESARLPGVDDTVILNANHRTLLRRMTVPGVELELETATPPAIPEIVKRLEN